MDDCTDQHCRLGCTICAIHLVLLWRPADSGAIDVQELKAALNALNQYPTEAELSKIMKEVRCAAAPLRRCCSAVSFSHRGKPSATTSLHTLTNVKSPYSHAQFDSDNSKEIEFHEFTKVISKQESMGHQMTDTEEAFIALGGNVNLHFLREL